MKIACSWCRKEGKTEIVGEKAPLDDDRETHGICATHLREVQAPWQASSGVTARSGAPHGPGISSVLFRWIGSLKVIQKLHL
jgi:hypothetical protein